MGRGQEAFGRHGLGWKGGVEKFAHQKAMDAKDMVEHAVCVGEQATDDVALEAKAVDVQALVEVSEVSMVESYSGAGEVAEDVVECDVELAALKLSTRPSWLPTSS